MAGSALDTPLDTADRMGYAVTRTIAADIAAANAATALSGSEIFPCVQGGAGAAATANQIKTFANILAFLSTLTASNSASLAWTGLTGDNYVLVLSDLLPATNGTTLYLQFGEGATPTWKTSSAYDTSLAISVGGGVGGLSLTDVGIQMCHFAQVANTGFGVSGTININGLATNGHLHTASGIVSHSDVSNSNALVMVSFAGCYHGDNNPITALRLIPTSGNLTSGKASLYSLAD